MGAFPKVEELVFAFRARSQTSCSMSFENSHENARYTLSLSPPHAVTLVVEHEYTRESGSSPLRYTQGYRGVNRRFETRRIKWEGTGGQRESTLEFRFEKPATCIHVSDPKFPCVPPSSKPLVTCTLGNVEAFPTETHPSAVTDARAYATPQIVRAYRCSSLASLGHWPTEGDALGEIPLAPRPGLILSVEEGHLASQSPRRRELRIAPVTR